MTKTEKVKNIFAFLSILFEENEECLEEIMRFSPDYIIEKYMRYIESLIPESPWGLHPSLRRSVFDKYCEKYGLLKDEV